jgi:hypothetical protein
MGEDIDNDATLAVAHLYHCWITGLVLGLITHKGPEIAAEFVYQLFRRQHLERFLPGLKKLGLDQLPHAVAAARYHYFSNQLGGVKVEYFEESERKAWIRYPPPRWMWAGTAICAVPSMVNNSMMRGWHAHNGVSLANPRLGFVCTGTTVDGASGLEGYYLEYERTLAPEERLRFAPNESCPRIDPTALPKLDIDTWPAARQAKAYRNYAMEYIRNGLPLLLELIGQNEGRRPGRLWGMQIGMQSYDDVSQRLRVAGNDATRFMEMFEMLLRASGDEITRKHNTVERTVWRLFAGIDRQPGLIETWRAPFSGLLAVHDRFLQLNHDHSDRFSITTQAE